MRASRFADPDRLEGWERLYREAVVSGVDDTGCEADEERLRRPLWLLGEVIARLPLLAVAVPLLERPEREPVREMRRDVLLAARGRAAGAVRLLHRALEVHARDVGYDPRRWRAEAPLVAAAITARLEARGFSGMMGLVHDVAADLGDAIAAVEIDRMAVPEQLAVLLGRVLALYARARDGAAAL